MLDVHYVTTIARLRSAAMSLPLILLLAGGILPAHAGDAGDRMAEFHIAALPLADALSQFGSQSGLQVVYEPDIASGLKAHPLSGRLTADAALQRLLAGTGLTWSYVNGDTVLLKRTEASVEPQGAAEKADRPRVARPVAQVPMEELAQIVVTAQKKQELLNEVPIPVTAIQGETLVSSNQLRLQDYYTSIPGLIVSPTPATGANQMITIRGISPAGFGNPTVGIMIDDVPYGSSTNLGGGLTVEDIDPGDLARIEVLRGPQGTLYGANSLGGLIKFVTVDPTTRGLSGSVQAGGSSVHNGAEPGYNLRGSLNLPVDATLAVRVSGFFREDPGFIDNAVLGRDGINKTKAYGGRVSALWRPSPSLSLKLSALVQTLHGDGLNDVNIATNGYSGPPLGDLQQNYIRNVGGYFKKVQAYTAILNAKVGIADVVSITGYNVNSEQDSFDLTYALGPFTQDGLPGSGFNGFGVAGSPLLNIQKTEKFVQEVRVSAPIGPRLEGLLGAFYTHENSPASEIFQAEDTATGRIVGQGLYFAFPSTYAEYAAFGDLTVHLNNDFDVQFGGRQSHIKQSSSSANIGPMAPIVNGVPDPTLFPEVSVDANAFTYLVTPRLKLSPDLMVYARIASGYRTGGTNVIPGVPPRYAPDKTLNYEVGLKGDFLEHTLSVDTSVYYIDWKDIQISLQQTLGIYAANAGRARSQGVELSIESRPVRDLKIGGWAAWNDGKLTKDFPSDSTAVGAKGDRLPFTSRLSAALSIEDHFPLFARADGFVGATLAYVGDQKGSFPSVFFPDFPRQSYSSYAKTDLRAGAAIDPWTVSLFVNNIADRRALIGGGNGAFPPYAFSVIQPRTIGLSLTRSF